MTQTVEVNADFPRKLRFLFEPSRYKIAYGGRGGAKSWAVARSLLVRGAQRKLRVLCAREIQKSIAESVHYLLKEQIQQIGLASFYRINDSSILGRNGTEFIFAGLRHNIHNIKSMESVDIVWVEEAHTVSKNSWDVLIPTIRKEGSEIIVTFNPELDTDETYKRFVLNPPPGAKVVKIGWRDNPWFPDVLRQEMEHLRATDPDAYNHVWEGFCRQMLDGAVYAAELRAVEAEGRITRVPYDATAGPVHTFWDLGFGDSTSIWFAQAVGFEYHLIDFCQANQQALQHYLKVLQGKPYIYGIHYLPHDARAHELGSGRTIEEQMRGAGFPVRITPRLSVADGIAAARAVFPRCWFDVEKCTDGVQALRHYRYEQDEKLLTFKKEPLHDWASHPADAFRYFAVMIQEPARKRKQEEAETRAAFGGGDGWMLA